MTLLSFLFGCVSGNKPTRNEETTPINARPSHRNPELQTRQQWHPDASYRYNHTPACNYSYSVQNNRNYLPYRPNVGYSYPSHEHTRDQALWLNRSYLLPTPLPCFPPTQPITAVVRSQLSYSVSSRRAPAAARVPRLDRMPAYDNLRNMVGEIECGVSGIPSTHRPRDRRTAVSKTPPSLRHDRVGAGLNDRFYRPDGSGSSVNGRSRSNSSSSLSSSSSSSSFSSLSSSTSTSSSCNSTTSTRAVCDMVMDRRQRRQPLASDVRPPALVSSRSQSPSQTLQQMVQSASPGPLRSNPPLADGRPVLPSTRHLSFAQRASLAMAQAACPPPLDDLPLPLPRIPSVHGAGRRSARQIVQWRQPGPSRLANIDREAEDDE